MAYRAIARAARRNLVINSAEKKLDTRKPSEQRKRFPPPDKPRKKHHGSSASKIAAIRHPNPHLRKGGSREQIHFRYEPRRLERRKTKAAPGKGGSKPAGQVPAKLTFVVIENPAAKRFRFGRAGLFCGLRNHGQFWVLDLINAEELERLVPEPGQSQDRRSRKLFHLLVGGRGDLKKIQQFCQALAGVRSCRFGFA